MKITINKLLVAAVVGLSAQAPAHADQHALLIGVGNYQDPGIKDLEGPIHDVAVLKTVLQTNWDVSAKNISTLVDEQATESNIKSAIQSLINKTSPGDDILIYFSGHGTSVRDEKFGARLILPHTSGALVAHDFDSRKHVARMKSGRAVEDEDDGLLIGRYETKPLLQKLSADRTVFVIVDSCFSGNAVRNIENQYTPKTKRLLNIKLGTESEPEMLRGLSGASRCAKCETHSNPSFDYDYDNVIYFGAAADNQLAIEHSQDDIDAGQAVTIDGKPHGGFSDALLRVLSSTSPSNGNTINYRQLFNQLLNKFKDNCHNCGHSPVLMPVSASDTLSKPVLSKTTWTSNETDSFSKESTEISRTDSSLQVMSEDLGQPINRAIELVEAVDLNKTHPDISLIERDNKIEARSADGLLITTFTADTPASVLTEWVAARSWLKQRSATDAKQSRGNIRAYIGNPLINPVGYEGDHVRFTVTLEEDARLVMLVTNSLGKVSLLYPRNRKQSERVFQAKDKEFKFPSIEAADIEVREPWGTDHVTIYALPADSSLGTALLPLAKRKVQSFSHNEPLLARYTSALDSNKTQYSASQVLFHATQR